DRQSVIGLKCGQRMSRRRSENAVDGTGVITVTLQLHLRVHYHLIRRQIVVAVDGAVIWIIRSGEIAPRREPESGIKEESVVIDYYDLEVPSPKVTIMKFVTMQIHRFRETDPVTVDHHILVLVNRDVSIAVHPYILL